MIKSVHAARTIFTTRNSFPDLRLKTIGVEQLHRFGATKVISLAKKRAFLYEPARKIINDVERRLTAINQ
jgi:hypothetical protein